MNRKIIGIVAVVLLLAPALTYRAEIAKAVGAFLRSGSDNPQYQTSSSTTTPNALLTGTGTTTLTMSTGDFSSLTVSMQTLATTTAAPYSSTLEIQPYASDNGIDFFAYDQTKKQTDEYSIGTTSIPLASTTIPFTFIPSTIGATTTKVFNLDLIPSRFTRLVFSLRASTTPFTVRDSMNLWVNVAGHIQNY